MKYEEKEILLKGGKRALLRAPRPEDAAALIEYLIAVCGESEFLAAYPEERQGMTVEGEKAWIERQLASPDELCIDCEIDGKIAGQLNITFFTALKTRHRAEIGIAIRREFWGFGIGTALMTEALAAARCHAGTEIVELNYIEGNDRGVALYRKMGFSEVSRIPDAIRLKDGSSRAEITMQYRIHKNEPGKLTYAEILRAAAEQSAIDLGCTADDLLGSEPKVVRSVADPRARKYLRLPFVCNIVTYGRAPVASVGDARDDAAVAEFISGPNACYRFETPDLYQLNAIFEARNARVRHMAEYFLPDPDLLAAAKKTLPAGLSLRLMEQSDFSGLYLPEWSNALCADRPELDVLGVGAVDESGALVGFAACSADCGGMWQIGIDVLPAYRRRGIASALTARLADEIFARGKIPFYCAAWSNVASVRSAIRAGFRPAWVEMTVKPIEK